MSRTISPRTGKTYGIQRTCFVWEQARSTFYEKQARRRCVGENAPPKKRGPKPSVADEALLELIKIDLDNSPFQGEGHRKVWARLRFGQEVVVGRNRVLRIMRQHQLLSPYRTRKGQPLLHDGTICTQAPNLMWGTDGAKVFTLDEGWIWIFSAVEHWNGECVGWHVTKRGDRFAALEPISQGLTALYGGVHKNVGLGLALRMDHGTQYLSDHFIRQIRFWGIKPSFAFVEQPETNGIAERFNRTLKEQAIYGRIFRNVQDVRRAVGEFVALYNAQWRLEKNGFTSPTEARNNWLAAQQNLAA